MEEGLAGHDVLHLAAKLRPVQLDRAKAEPNPTEVAHSLLGRQSRGYPWMSTCPFGRR